MKKFLTLMLPLAIASCATQTPPMKDVEASKSAQQQRAAQQAMHEQQQHLALKRKIAVGRISNETNYGRSLLRLDSSDELGRKVTDIFVQSLSNSGNYLIFERPDVQLLRQESELSGQEIDIIGVDTLVIGSLTEFGRATTGETGFLSSSKKQEATAKVDLRLVDTSTGRVFASVTGSGAASTETASTMGFGSVASYDGSINDRAIGAAVNAAVEKLTQVVMEKPWSADILTVENGQIYISGGKSQGVEEGMIFKVMTAGQKIKSTTTGGTIALPGKQVAQLEIIGTFGESELEEGAYGRIVEGSIAAQKLSELQVMEVAK